MGTRVRAAFVVSGALLAVAVFVTVLERLLPSREAGASPPGASRAPERAANVEVREEPDGSIVIRQGWSQTRIRVDGTERRRAFLECLRAGIARDSGEGSAPPPPAQASGEQRSLWTAEGKARKKLDALVYGCLPEPTGLPPVPPVPEAPEAAED